MGEWTGSTFEQLNSQPLWHRFNFLRSLTRAPGGESMIEVQSRIIGELECLRLRHPEQVLAVVSHADVIKAAVAHIAGIPLDLFHRIEISPASVTVLSLGERSVRIQRVNDTGSFEAGALWSRGPL